MRRGFLLYLQYILRCVPGALVFAGIPCSAHIWMSQGTTKKSRRRPLGDPDVKMARDGNALACRWALGIAVAVVRQVLWAGEQPSSSVLPFLDCVQFILNINAAGFGYPAGMLVRLPLGCIYKLRMIMQIAVACTCAAKLDGKVRGKES